MQIYKKLTEHLKIILTESFKERENKLLFYGVVLVLLVGIGLNVLIPFILKEVVDSFSLYGGTLVMSLLFISYGLIWTASHVFFHIRALLTQKIEQRLTFILEIKILTHLYTLSLQYFLTQKPGSITNVIRRAQRNIPTITLGILFHVLPTVLEFFAVFAVIIYKYPILYSIQLGGMLLPFVTYTILSTPAALKSRQVANEIEKEVDGTVTDLLSNHELINIFGQKEFAINTCKVQLKKREEAEVNFIKKVNYIYTIQTLILGLGLTVTTFFVGKGVESGHLTIGDFILFNGYILQLITPITILGQVTQEIKKAIVDMKGVVEILLITNTIKESQCPIPLLRKCFPVTFQNVSFKYGNLNILNDVSFHIEHGATFFIVGPSGVGKSTIAKLLLRLYDPDKGKILIQNVDIKDISFKSLYQCVSSVPQEASLFHDTIKNNLQFVCPDASISDIEAALDKASLSPFIKSLPEGINTHVGSRGLRLSAGERQRLALARIFLKKPKICIFDEANSFLDKATDMVIQDNIRTFLFDVTKIIITHRPFNIDPNTDTVFEHPRKL